MDHSARNSLGYARICCQRFLLQRLAFGGRGGFGGFGRLLGGGGPTSLLPGAGAGPEVTAATVPVEPSPATSAAEEKLW
jgi:hypothetical protein